MSRITHRRHSGIIILNGHSFSEIFCFIESFFNENFLVDSTIFFNKNDSLSKGNDNRRSSIVSNLSDSIRRESQPRDSLQIEKPKMKLERSPSKVRFELDNLANENKTLLAVSFCKSLNKMKLNRCMSINYMDSIYATYNSIFQESPMPAKSKEGLRLSQLNASELHKR